VRTHRGLRERTMESQFLRELPSDVIIQSDQGDEFDFDPFEDEFAGGGAGRGRRRRGSSLLTSFPEGCTVKHPTFGVGRVEHVTPRPAGSSARVTFEGIGTKTLILEYAKLERLD
jgi:hypothetical protein